MSESPLKVWLEHDGSLLRLQLARPKANIIDAAMISALSSALKSASGASRLRAVLLDAQGPHFSFGASVEEHMPDLCAEMLASLHTLIKQMLDCPVPILVAIQGQCLGGGLEVACGGDLLFAHPEAKMGQPEIKLGVFAPAASCLLPARIGAAQAQDLLWSGRSIDGGEAYRIGLVNELADDPTSAALAWFEKYLQGGSASSLRLAVKAVQADAVDQLKTRLDTVEALYIQDLMETHDAVEGLQAFVEKRAANWEHR
ncbi:MAG: cyclohexa-1,5-dienecarbonyl-CoA hydratase [Halieaceae bacterium]|jgi:cyclohexa-1,5-dienecarbonyl-CoA hydratase|nr:cyclohexa-1,5-dienecarbonyl-CoA hydratase [Halieaceae bacterium]